MFYVGIVVSMDQEWVGAIGHLNNTTSKLVGR